VTGEFLFGQLLAGASATAFLETQEYLASFECLNADEQTSLLYAQTRVELKKRGITLPDPDFWIAAHALQNHLPLVTTDTDFQQVSGIRLYLIKI